MSQGGRGTLVRYRFGDFELDDDLFILLRSGTEVRVEPRVLEVLVYLVRNSGRLVLKNEILDEVWPEEHVGDAALKKAVQEARRAIGDDGVRQRFIKTVHGRGYRWVADLSADPPVAAPATRPGSASAPAPPDRANPPGAAPARRPLGAVIGLGAALAILIVGGLLTYSRSPGPSGRQRLVVLPFSNLGQSTDEYLVAGLTEGIRGRISATRSVGVISPGSLRDYDRSGRTLRELGEDFGADFVLEGSISVESRPKGRSQLQVAARLSRTGDEALISSTNRSFDQDELPSIQRVVADWTLEELGLPHQRGIRKPVADLPTRNLAAYQAFLKAKTYKRWGATVDELWIALHLLDQATELDPDFALAYVEKYWANERLFVVGHDRSRERVEAGKAALDQALRLDPDLPEAHQALGHSYTASGTAQDYDRAIEEFEIAARRHSDEAALLEDLGHVLRLRGQWSEALVRLEDAYTLNPRSPWLTLMLGQSYTLLRRYEEAEPYYERTMILVPDLPEPYAMRAASRIAWKGDLAAARSILDSLPPKVDGWSVYVRWLILMMERDFKGAIDFLSSAPAGLLQIRIWTLPRALLEARTYDAIGDPEAARASYEEALAILESELAKGHDGASLQGTLGIVYAGLGRKTEAIAHGQTAVTRMPVSTQATDGPLRVMELAEIYTMVGEPTAAVQQLDYLLSIPSIISPAWLRLDPRWDPLRTREDFQRLTGE